MAEGDGLTATIHLDREVLAIRILFQVALPAIFPVGQNR
jgi:hypothetical protein